MKIQFESQLEYQNHAINSIVNIFEGQEICQSNFTVTGINDNLLTYQNDLGIGNRLELLDDEILSNVQNIQLKNGLPQTKSVKDIKTMDFSVEMETGTGKTYVYLKTIFEMNKKFGFTKFIIVVPSIAIKEGTNKTLEITNEHFKGLFDNVNYDYFVYDSSNLEQVRDFATITGSVAALTSALASLPYPAGLIAGLITATAVTAAGAIQVAAIQKQKFDAGTPPQPPKANIPSTNVGGLNQTNQPELS